MRVSNQYFDQETGYHYNGQRYYDPLTARYLRNDPIGLEGGHNTYNFALKNPLKYVDLDGRESRFALRLDQRVRDYSSGNITAKEYLDSNLAEGIGGSIGGALVVGWFLAPEALLLLSARAPTLTAIATDLTAAEIGMTTGGAALAAKRGSGTLRGVFSSKPNSTGGELVTSNGNIVQSQVSSEVQRALYQDKNVDILSGVHGFSDGTMKKELQFFADDVKAFGDLLGVTIHNINSMSKTQIQNIMKNDSTVIGAFCHSGACLKP
jgi:RHS repeat-associated protein